MSNAALALLHFQLIKLINCLKSDVNDTILNKIAERSHSYNGFAFNVTRTILDTYDPICRIALHVMSANVNNTWKYSIVV